MKNKTDNLNRIIYIILVIYYIKKEKYNPVNVINKDKNIWCLKEVIMTMKLEKLIFIFK